MKDYDVAVAQIGYTNQIGFGIPVPENEDVEELAELICKHAKKKGLTMSDVRGASAIVSLRFENEATL